MYDVCLYHVLSPSLHHNSPIKATKNGKNRHTNWYNNIVYILSLLPLWLFPSFLKTMALTSISFLFFLLSMFSATVSSLTCSTQKLTGTKVYPNCIDLPVLNSFLHYTHDTSNSTLSVVFVATPPSPGGWISWGINPTATGMVGAQVIVAFKNNGVMAMKTLDLKSYKVFIPGKLSFDVWDMKAEEAGGLMKIFATVKVPVDVTAINHVWQVGPSVTAGMIAPHDFNPSNLNSKGRLSLNGAKDFGNNDDAPLDFVTKKKNVSF